MLAPDPALASTLPEGYQAACQGCRRPIDPAARVHLFPGLPCPGFKIDPRPVVGWTTQTLAVYRTMPFEPPPVQVWSVRGRGGWWNYHILEGWRFTEAGGVPVDADTTGTEWWVCE